MGTPSRKGPRGRVKRAKLPTYYFLDEDLHRRLHISRSTDLIRSWNYTRGYVATLNYSTVLSRHKQAWTTTETAELINRSVRSIEDALRNGMVERPQMTYTRDERRRPFKYMWCEKDIMDVREYFAGVHNGRPRKDGKITNNDIPSEREVRALMRGDNMLYVKQGDEYVQTWRA